MHDSQSAVFRNSLGIKLNSNPLNLPTPNSLPWFPHKMPYVGDNAFPLKQNLMKPYPDRNLYHREDF